MDIPGKSFLLKSKGPSQTLSQEKKNKTKAKTSKIKENKTEKKKQNKIAMESLRKASQDFNYLTQNRHHKV